ncbi:MAG: hypothetical protein ACI35O_08100 [Bacillaceae bacterium]
MIIKNETYSNVHIINWLKDKLVEYHIDKYGENCIVVDKNEPDKY